MRLATIRVRDVVVMSLDCPRLDIESAPIIRSFVGECVDAGARTIVLEFGVNTTIDFAGARCLVMLSEHLGGRERFRVCGLGPRANAFLRSTRVSEIVSLYESWTDAFKRAA